MLLHKFDEVSEVIVDLMHSLLVEPLQNLSKQLDLVHFDFRISLDVFLERLPGNLFEVKQNLLLKHLVTLQVLGDEAESIRFFCRFEHLLVLQLFVGALRQVKFPVENVVSNRSIEQIWLLLHDAHLRSKTFEVQIFDFKAIQKYLSTLAVIKAEKKGRDR